MMTVLSAAVVRDMLDDLEKPGAARSLSDGQAAFLEVLRFHLEDSPGEVTDLQASRLWRLWVRRCGLLAGRAA